MSRIVSKILKNRFLVSLILYMTVSLIVSLIQRKVKGSISETRTFILFLDRINRIYRMVLSGHFEPRVCDWSFGRKYCRV